PTKPIPSPARHTLSLHDALPIWSGLSAERTRRRRSAGPRGSDPFGQGCFSHIELTSADLGLACVVVRLCRTQTLLGLGVGPLTRSEEHTSELQSRFELVCRPLLE